MEFPKLNPRPEAKMVCTAFRGLDRRPGASNKSYNKRWQWGWHDERNLSSDRYPRLSVRKKRKRVFNIDGNEPVDKIVGMCGGDHPVLLDQTGVLWSNGHSVDLPIGSAVRDQKMHYKIVITNPVQATVTITPSEGVDSNWTDLNEIGVHYDNDANKWVIDNPKILWRYGDDQHGWECDFGTNGATWTAADPADYDITVTADNNVDGLGFTIRLWEGWMTAITGRTLIRMGSRVIIWEDKIWIDAVKLAAGTFDEQTDEGFLEADVQNVSGDVGDDFTMTLCDIDGNAYSGVVVSSSEPVSQEGYWLDTSQATAVLREWNYIQTTWVTVTASFVKVGPFGYSNADDIREGDAVNFAVYNAATADAKALLNGSHYIYKVIESGGAWYYVLSGVLSTDSENDNGLITVSRDVPALDFVVESGNRLWGCRYSETNSINEIYASKLGDAGNWEVYQGLSTDSWRASRGTPAPFTGAAVLDGHPLFFREESLEKVYPSSSGAHQIQTYSLEGVQKGSDRSLVIIDERLYYKSRLGICVYTGTLPARISEEFNDWQFSSATAARHGDKYVCCMTRADGEHLCLVYDLASGDWHVEDETWDGMAVTWKDVCYYVKDGEIYAFDSGSGSTGLEWFAESDEMSLELPEHKWIKTLRFRYQMELGASCRVYMSYDGGPWERKADLHGNRLHSAEAEIWPRRCDHFRLRLEGRGGFELQSISYRVERSQGGR